MKYYYANKTFWLNHLLYCTMWFRKWHFNSANATKFSCKHCKTVKCGHWYSTIFITLKRIRGCHDDARRQCCRRFVFTCKTENLPHGNVLSFRMKKKIAELSTMCRSHLLAISARKSIVFNFASEMLLWNLSSFVVSRQELKKQSVSYNLLVMFRWFKREMLFLQR